MSADAWWNSLPLDRREQIWRWIERPEQHVEVAGQLEIPIPRQRRR